VTAHRLGLHRCRQGRAKALVLGVGAERRLGAATARRFAGEVTTSAQAGDDGDVAAGDYPRKMEAPSAFGGVQRTKRITFAEEGSPADLILFNLGSNQPYDFRTLSAEISIGHGAGGCVASPGARFDCARNSIDERSPT
jgi:hypothetical protein